MLASDRTIITLQSREHNMDLLVIILADGQVMTTVLLLLIAVSAAQHEESTKDETGILLSVLQLVIEGLNDDF